jgi:hypothetical protein
MPVVPEAVSECMGRRACLPQVQVDIGMALGLYRSAQHLELTKHVIVLTPAARGRLAAGMARAPGRVKNVSVPASRQHDQPSSKPGGRHASGGRASMNSERDRSNRRGRHKTRLNPYAGHHRRQASGDWKQRRDRYLALAQTAASAGNAVEAENYYQHAEHYFRLMQQGA